MGSVAETNPKPSLKPLGLLGRDEMNLAEFPITLLTDRVPKDQKEAVYQDEIFDEKMGLTLTRKLTISAGNHGLTTAADDEVILSLIQLTKQKNNFTNRRLDFSRHELVQMLGWSVGGASYERILLSLKRWTSVFLQYENAWRDNRTKTWTTAGFHIIDKYELTDNRMASDQFDLIPSYIVWGEDIFESFQAGYLKPLDYDLCMGLSNSTAKRMYRFLDKRFHHKPDWTFDLKELAHEHIGLGRHYEGPAHLKRNLMPAITELESIGFLEPLSPEQRFPKEGKSWKVRLIQQTSTTGVVRVTTPTGEPEQPPLVAELTKRGITARSAVELVKLHPAEGIQAKIEVFDWLVEKQDKRVAKSPEGYLVKSISDDYKTPKGFVPAVERQRQQEERQARERLAAEDRRRQRAAETHEQDIKRQVAAYWDSLTPEQQAECQAAADAQTDPASLALEYGPLKRMGQHIRREQYIRQLLAAREPSEA
jgi:hypothetical protein